MNINGAHWHLIVNHVSLFALIFGAGALIASMARKSAELRELASVLFVVAGVFGWIADETGGQAAHILRTFGNEFRPLIHEHALAAEWAERSGILVGILTLAMEWAVRKKPTWFNALRWILLIFALHGVTVFARTAYLGGLVRHPEIRENTPIAQPANQSQTSNPEQQE